MTFDFKTNIWKVIKLNHLSINGFANQKNFLQFFFLSTK